MRALTLIQPWAHAIIHCGKRVENRSWPPPLLLLGKRIAIHAGKGWDDVPRSTWSWPGGITGPPIRQACTYGAVVGVAMLLGWCDTRGIDHCETEAADPAPQARLDDLTDDPWWVGPVGWLLGDVIALPEPVPCRGWQRLWRLPDEVEVMVARQLPAQPGRPV